MKFTLITQKKELLLHKQSIAALFKRSYGKDLDLDLWSWAYIDNPCGNPVVSLCFNNESLIGHYAVIPFQLVDDEKELKAFLSMTTMVDPDYQGQGLFTKQANHVYEVLPGMGCQFVYGFPNENSVKGFRKYLGWDINENDYVAKVTKQDLTKSNDFIRYIQMRDNVHFDVNNNTIRQWRLNKPNSHYFTRGNTILKVFQGEYDIVYLNSDFKEELDDGFEYNILLDSSVEDLRKKQVFSYQSGFRCFDKSAIVRLKKDLLISDVF